MATSPHFTGRLNESLVFDERAIDNCNTLDNICDHSKALNHFPVYAVL